MNTIAQIREAKTADLIAFFNQYNPEKPVKKFADRAAAISRCEKLLVRLQLDGVIEYVEGDIPSADEEAADRAMAEAKAEKQPEVVTPEVSEPEPEVIEQEQEPEVGSGNPLQDLLNGMHRMAGGKGDTKPVDLPGTKKAPKVEPEPEPRAPRERASNAAGVAASWADPTVAAARLTRHGVEVTVEGATQGFKSVREAFRAYRLPDSKHIRFRLKLKASREEVFVHNEVSYKFVLVGSDE